MAGQPVGDEANDRGGYGYEWHSLVIRFQFSYNSEGKESEQWTVCISTQRIDGIYDTLAVYCPEE